MGDDVRQTVAADQCHAHVVIDGLGNACGDTVLESVYVLAAIVMGFDLPVVRKILFYCRNDIYVIPDSAGEGNSAVCAKVPVHAP